MRARLRAALVAAALTGALVVAIPPPPVAAGACDFVTCTLTILTSGNGSGTWQTTTSNHNPDNKINCAMVNGVKTPGSDCQQVYGTQDPTAQEITIYYTVVPATGSIGCLIDNSLCSIVTIYGQFTLTSTRNVTENFHLATYDVTVTRYGNGLGYVRSPYSEIDCGLTCTFNYAYGTQLELTATAYPGSYFAGWIGAACQGQTYACDFTVSGPTSIGVTFSPGSPPTASPPAPTQSAPAPTPSAGATATAKPVGTPHASPTASASPTIPGSSDASPSAPIEPDGSATANPDASSAPPSAAPTEPPDAPASATGSDLTPIVLAILGAGLLMAIGIGVVGVALLRRRPPPA